MMPRKKNHLVTEEDIHDIRCHIRQAIRKKLIMESDKDDIEQELVVCLLRKTKQFQKSKSSWKTYRRLLVKAALCDLVRRKIGPSSYESRKAPFSIDDPIPMECGESDNILWRDIINQDGVFADGTEHGEEYERLDLIIDVREAVATMPKHLQRLSRVLMEEGAAPKPELAKRLRVSTRTIFYWFDELKVFLLARGFDSRI